MQTPLDGNRHMLNEMKFLWSELDREVHTDPACLWWTPSGQGMSSLGEFVGITHIAFHSSLILGKQLTELTVQMSFSSNLA